MSSWTLRRRSSSDNRGVEELPTGLSPLEEFTRPAGDCRGVGGLLLSFVRTLWPEEVAGPGGLLCGAVARPELAGARKLVLLCDGEDAGAREAGPRFVIVDVCAICCELALLARRLGDACACSRCWDC
jgi:hypothetical protein